jgi:hypothetical protein
MSANRSLKANGSLQNLSDREALLRGFQLNSADREVGDTEYEMSDVEQQRQTS